MSSGDLPKRTDFHFSRRVFHMLAGLFIVSVALWIQERGKVIAVSTICCLGFIFFELLRLKWKALGRWVGEYFSFVMRDQERESWSGMPFFAFGVLISFIVFPLPIAVFSILFLSFGDPIASLVGCYFRRKGWAVELVQGKSLQGSLSCALVGLILCVILGPYFFDLKFWGLGIWGFALAGAFACALGELMPLRTDDNLSIPLISGALLWLYTSFANLTPGLIHNF